MNIIEACKDPNLFRPFLGDDLSSWAPWFAALRAVYGLPIESERGRELVRECSGRDPGLLAKEGYSTALMLTGRRSGKSRASSIIGAFEAALSGREAKLARGEVGLVAIISPTKQQSSIVKSYLRSIFNTPLLAREVVAERKDGFELRNGVQIQILSGDWRSVRGFTLLAAVVDELCFFGLDEESKVKSDTELVRALLPSLATTGGPLIGISSPYTPSGWAHGQWKRHFGNDATNTLVWMAPSRTMNPTLPQKVVDDAMAEDPEGASSEYMACWRQSLSALVPREVVENLVVFGRKELMPQKKKEYFAFCDVSGGRNDDAALAIAHLDDRKVVIDKIKAYQTPFDPYTVIGDMARELERWDIRTIVGDNYSAEFTRQAFTDKGIIYEQSKKTKSDLYLELLPRMCSGEVELPDHPELINQLCRLQRKTRAGGKDKIDHPPGGKDDIANAVAGAVYFCAASLDVIEVGGYRPDESFSPRDFWPLPRVTITGY